MKPELHLLLKAEGKHSDGSYKDTSSLLEVEKPTAQTERMHSHQLVL